MLNLTLFVYYLDIKHYIYIRISISGYIIINF